LQVDKLIWDNDPGPLKPFSDNNLAAKAGPGNDMDRSSGMRKLRKLVSMCFVCICARLLVFVCVLCVGASAHHHSSLE